jgi:tRNA(adenine34) deaminase
MGDILRTPEQRFADLPGFPWPAHQINDLPGFAGLTISTKGLKSRRARRSFSACTASRPGVISIGA